MTPTRPMIRYFGGKWRLAPWIIAHLPPHRIYVEPYGGAASVLLRKPRAYAEVYNDADGEVVNLFRVARDDGAALLHALELTPFARDEYQAAYETTDDPLERARRTVVRAYMGFGADSVRLLGQYRSGFRANSNRSGSTPAHDWATYPSAFAAIVERLRGVVIENRDALDVMRQHDAPDALHYVDPPYVHETRGRAGVHGYEHEMTDEQHTALLTFLRELTGFVVLSGYLNPLYDFGLDDWHRVDIDAHADGARPRVESLWLSPRTWRALQQSAPDPLGLNT